ncbi:MAG: TIGR04283 family arsenosugar biosynthesis glycosyltransferase [Ectothiorhodospiraceae bacterium]|nr:TIGR04283 family arsenosugar biosynthesis glycosyltransferase [Ectothiorhodospiraceae bacterium]
MRISFVIPVLNEENIIGAGLKNLQWLRQLGHEIIVVDGGSRDDTATSAKLLACRVIRSFPGRSLQMNEGAKASIGDVLCFLHIDTEFPHDGVEAVKEYLEGTPEAWGRFDVKLSGRHIVFRVIERMMNWRSRLTGVATGDQAIFITRRLFEKINGYPLIPLMEDIEISNRLKQHSPPICLRQQVTTSSRRWEVGGIYKTVWLMWRLRFAYWRGSDPGRLAQRYRQ